jgi:hypothetical protein
MGQPSLTYHSMQYAVHIQLNENSSNLVFIMFTSLPHGCVREQASDVLMCPRSLMLGFIGDLDVLDV